MSSPSPKKHASKQPRTRPPLPKEHANPLLDGSRKNSVRTQTLNLENGMFIDIARVKLPTPGDGTDPKRDSGRGNHHIIKRFDTGAISASTMFRAAFPTSSPQAERAELTWITENYDTHGPGNGDNPAAKLTGIWVSLDAAKKLANDYGLDDYVDKLFTFEPEKKLRSPSPAPNRVTKRQRLASRSPQPEPHTSATTKTAKTTKSVSKDVDGAAAVNNTTTATKTTTSPGKGAIPPSPSGSESTSVSPNRSLDVSNTSSSITKNALLNSAAEVKAVPVKSDGAKHADVPTEKDGKQQQLKFVTGDVETELAKGKELAERVKESVKKADKEESPSTVTTTTTITTKRRRSVSESDNDDSKKNNENDESGDEEILSFWQRTLGRSRRNNNKSKSSRSSGRAASGDNNDDDMDIQEPRQISPLRRQLAAFAGVVLVGAATAVTPYLLG